MSGPCTHQANCWWAGFTTRCSAPGITTGSNRSATIPSSFTISVESELGDLLPIYTNPPVKGNPNFGTDVLVAFNEKSKHQGDVFALRVPVIGI